MKKTEIVLVILFLLGILLSLVPVPGGLLLIVFSGGLLSILYFIFSLWILNNIRARDLFKKAAYAEITPAKAILSIFTGLNISTVIVGIQFRFMLWKNSHIMLMLGLLNIAIVLTILILMALFNKKISYRPYFLKVGLLGLMNLLLFTTSDLDIVEIRYREHPAYVELYKQYATDPSNMTVREEMRAMEQQMLEEHRK